MKSIRYVLNLTDEVLIAIGSVSAQWATLEYYLARTTGTLAERGNNPVSKLAARIAFLERRNAFVASAEWPNVPANVKLRVKELADRMEQAENKRHKIIHGMANEDYDPVSPLTGKIEFHSHEIIQSTSFQNE
jgi:hypothetical protein